MDRPWVARAASRNGVDCEGWDATGLADVEGAASECDASRTAERMDKGGVGSRWRGRQIQA